MSPDLRPSSDAPSGAAWTRRYCDAVMNTFGSPQRVLVRGEGCYVWDADGNRYLDLLAGIAIALGHDHAGDALADDSLEAVFHERCPTVITASSGPSTA